MIIDEYSFDLPLYPNLFSNYLQNDFACFALWASARPFHDKIRRYLNNRFEIIFETEVEWSIQNFQNNASRLYEMPIFYDVNGSNGITGHTKKIGGNKFIIIIVKDTHPIYTYARTVSGKIEPSNINVINSKYLFRDWIFNDSGTKYGVHSTNNLYEFFFQAPLILGIDLFKDVLEEKKPIIKKLNKDLEGANGWSNWKDLFRILNLTVNYLILRNFEKLPQFYNDSDLDVLTDNYQRLASAIGAKQYASKKYKGVIQVKNRIISLDIRFIGDNYYNSSWQKDMLTLKILRNGVYIPRDDHYFFSLLYHSKVQKLEVKEQYISVLNRLAEQLKFNWYSKNILNDNQKTSEIINGFFKTYGYYYENPIDTQVIKNKKVINQLVTLENYASKEKYLHNYIRKLLKRILPENTYLLLKRLKKKVI